MANNIYNISSNLTLMNHMFKGSDTPITTR